MTSKATVLGIRTVRSHTVSSRGFGYGYGKVDHEELFPVVACEWRGARVEVDLEASRNASTDGVWAHPLDPEGWTVFIRDTRPAVTETAKDRLRDECKRIVREWIDGPDYPKSRKSAFRWQAHKLIRESGERLYMDEPTRDARIFLERYADELGPEAVAAALDACDALDDAGRKLEQAGGNRTETFTYNVAEAVSA